MKTISFDFDDTICLWPEAKVNQAIKDLIWKHKNAGDRVVLVTSRWDFTKEAVLIAFKEWDIPITEEDMYFTNGCDKSHIFFNQVKADAHYDDDEDQLATLEHHFKFDVFHVDRENITDFRERKLPPLNPIFEKYAGYFI